MSKIEFKEVYEPQTPAYESPTWAKSDVPTVDIDSLNTLLNELHARTGVTFLVTFSSGDGSNRDRLNGAAATAEQLELYKEDAQFPLPSYAVLVVLRTQNRDPRAGYHHTFAAGLLVSRDLKWNDGIGDDVAARYLRASGRFLDYRNNPNPTAYAAEVCNNLANALLPSLPPLPPPL